jgi:hypothetical protein
MSYKPLTKQQANDMARPPLIDDGTYQFELLEFSNHDKYHNELKDKNGDAMTKVKLKIWDIQGKERLVFTNLFWGEQNRMSYRTRHFAESLGLLAFYESGEMFDKFGECLNKMGHCEIYTQKERAKNDGTGENWPAKNEVKDFVVVETATKQAAGQDFYNDDVPF